MAPQADVDHADRRPPLPVGVFQVVDGSAEAAERPLAVVRACSSDVVGAGKGDPTRECVGVISGNGQLDAPPGELMRAVRVAQHVATPARGQAEQAGRERVAFGQRCQRATDPVTVLRLHIVHGAVKKA